MDIDKLSQNMEGELDRARESGNGRAATDVAELFKGVPLALRQLAYRLRPLDILSTRRTSEEQRKVIFAAEQADDLGDRFVLNSDHDLHVPVDVAANPLAEREHDFTKRRRSRLAAADIENRRCRNGPSGGRKLLVAKFRRACADAGVGIASVLPVLRWSGPDEDAREAAVRNWKRVIQITVDLGVNVINSEFSGRPERAEESERAFF